MKLILTCLFLFILSFPALAQDTKPGFESAPDSMQYLRDIETYASNPEVLSASSLYAVASICASHNDYVNTLKYLKLSLAKDSGSAKAYRLKGETMYNMQQYEAAITSYQAAIKLNPEIEGYYNGLGQCYYAMKNDEMALKTFQASTEHCRPDFSDQEPYTMMGIIYSRQKEYDKALEAYYNAVTRAAQGTEEYSGALYNIWRLELKKGNDAKSDSAFVKLLRSDYTHIDCPDLDCADYYNFTRIVQIYYHRKEYAKTKPYKDKLYEAHRRGLSILGLEDMYCFDQFEWKDKTIQAFERYENGTDVVFPKHIFYVKNQEGDVEFQIQTEYSPASVKQAGPKYIVCMQRGNTHSKFNIGFNDNFNYEDLKKAVIDILEGKVKPSSTTSK